MAVSGFRYWLVASGCPMPMPTISRPGKSRSRAVYSAASSAGSYAQTLTIDVPTTSDSEASSNGRTVGSRGEPPSQNVPKPQLLGKRRGGGGVLLADPAVRRPHAKSSKFHVFRLVNRRCS